MVFNIYIHEREIIYFIGINDNLFKHVALMSLLYEIHIFSGALYTIQKLKKCDALVGNLGDEKTFQINLFSFGYFAAFFHPIQQRINLMILFKSLQINLQYLKAGLNLHTVLKICRF
jgi:hypothetical protein